MCFIKTAQNRTIDKRVSLAKVTSIEHVIANHLYSEYKERHSTKIKECKTLNFHDSLDFLKNISLLLGFLFEHKFS